MIIVRTIPAMLAMLIALGCDREPVAPVGPRPPPTLAAQIIPITPLPPSLQTHLTADNIGQVYWVQHAASGPQVIYVISDGGLPSPTRMTSAAILEAIGLPDGEGSIQSLLATPDGRVYFYFSASRGATSACALGYFAAKSHQVKLLADANAIAGASGMKNSLALARGSIVLLDGALWLWLRHSDDFALLSLDLSRSSAAPRRPFTRVRAKDGDLKLLSSGDDLSAGNKSLLYLDRAGAKLWRIDSMGEATVLHNLADLPRQLTAPVLDDGGRLVAFAPRGPLFDERDEFLPVTRPIEWPALVLLNDQRKLIQRGAIAAPQRINVPSLSPNALARDRSGLVFYDGPTGELLRIKIVEKP